MVTNLQLLFIEILISQFLLGRIIPRPCLTKLWGIGQDGPYDNHQETEQHPQAQTKVQTNNEGRHKHHYPNQLEGEKRKGKVFTCEVYILS